MNEVKKINKNGNEENEIKSSKELVEEAYEPNANSFNVSLKIGRVVEFVKKIHQNNDSIVKGLCIILENSDCDESNVLICPLTFKIPSVKNYDKRIKIGTLPLINPFSNVYAKLEQIRYLDKKRLVKESIKKKNFGYVPCSTLELIQLSFFKLLNNRMNLSYEKSKVINHYC